MQCRLVHGHLLWPSIPPTPPQPPPPPQSIQLDLTGRRKADQVAGDQLNLTCTLHFTPPILHTPGIQRTRTRRRRRRRRRRRDQRIDRSRVMAEAGKSKDLVLPLKKEKKIRQQRKEGRKRSLPGYQDKWYIYPLLILIQVQCWVLECDDHQSDAIQREANAKSNK